MLSILANFVPLWASCLLICFGLTLMMVVRLPDLLTPHLRVVLLRVSCFTGLFFLVCTAQWIYALLLIWFMWDKYDHAYGRWLDEPTNRSLRTASGWLLVGGCLGLIDALHWLPVIQYPLLKVLSHPVISVGLTVAILVSACRSAIMRKSSVR